MKPLAGIAAAAARGSDSQFAHTPNSAPLTPPRLIVVPIAGTVPEPVSNGITRTADPSSSSFPPMPLKLTVSKDPKAAEWFAHW